MPIPVQCSGCQTQLNAPDTAVGKQIKCPRCQALIAVLAAAAPAPAPLDLDEEPAPPPAKKSGTTGQSASRKRRNDDDDDDERDRRRGKSFRQTRAAGGGSPPAALVFAVAGLIGLAIMGGVAYTGYALFFSGTDEAKGTGGGRSSGSSSGGGGDGGGGNSTRTAWVPHGWKEFRYPDSGFKVCFPSDPQVQVDRFSDQALYAATDGAQTTYTISSRRSETTTPAEQQASISGVIDLVRLEHTAARELGRRGVTWGGYPATEVVIEGSNLGPPIKKGPTKGVGPKTTSNRPTTVLRLMFAEGRLYTARIDTRGGRGKTEIENAFFDNFEVLK